MKALDTSVLVAAFATWHASHEAARAALDGTCRVPAHVLFETYSVLTRLPPPHRAAADVVAHWLDGAITEPLLLLPAREQARLLQDAAAAGIAGGAIYDALVGATARRAGLVLLTRDRRALPTYSMVGAQAEYLDES